MYEPAARFLLHAETCEAAIEQSKSQQLHGVAATDPDIRSAP
tara:strand:- start:82 stop:207 length:126 start_codon:yes stop_codon:yes gene_type:complete